MWANGASKNYGIVFISEEESKNVYNWRAFASKQYGTSAMRPYTVINYTNDTTKPTTSGITAVAILGELQNRKHIQRIKLCILALEIMPEILQQPAEIHI